jgi:hypothetical protein
MWHSGDLAKLLPDLRTCCDPFPNRFAMRAGYILALVESGDVDEARRQLAEVDFAPYEEIAAHHDQLAALSLLAVAASELDDVARG